MAKGKRTARSQAHRANDSLAQYGYPSDRHLRREAKNIARASAPTVRSIERPFNRQTQSAKDFMAAVMGALQQTSGGVGSAYDSALAQQQAVSQAAQTRLGGLGLGDTGAGVQAATGALGDSAASQLISNAASAKTYAAQLPSIAAGSAAVGIEGIRKQMQDALANRRDQVRQAYFPALSEVQGQALQRAGFNQSTDQFRQNMRLQQAQMAQSASQFNQSFGLQQQQYGEGVREFNIQQAASAHQNAFSNRLARSQFKAQYGYDPVSGKTSGAGLGPMSQYSPAQLAEIAKASAPQLAPSHSVRTTQRDKNGRTVGSTSLVIHQNPPAFSGQDFSMTVQEMMKNGVPANVAYYQAQQLYQNLGNVHSAMALAAGIFKSNGKKVPSFASFKASSLWRQMQVAYYSYLQLDPSVYSGNPRG